jgi:hypothetical protein
MAPAVPRSATGYLTVEFKGYIQAGGALGVFVLAYLFKPAALQGSSEWQAIWLTWRDLRDLSDDPTQVNQDDVVLAVNAVNEAARVIGDDDSLFRPFRSDYGKDYLRLYAKLLSKRYPLPHVTSTSDAQLTIEARRLSDGDGVGSRFRATTNHMEDAYSENDARPLPQNATLIHLPVLTIFVDQTHCGNTACRRKSISLVDGQAVSFSAGIFGCES